MKIEEFLKESSLFAAYKNYQRFRQQALPFFKENGVNFLEGMILISMVFEEKSKVFPKDLSVVLSSSKSSIGHSLAKLEENGLVKRFLSEEDSRMNYLQLTIDGKRKANNLLRPFEKLDEEFHKELF